MAEDSYLEGTGILPCQMIRKVIANKEILPVSELPKLNAISPDQVQPASIDLRLGVQAWRAPTSFLPGRKTSVLDKIKQLDGYPIDLREGAVLEKECVYVIPLLERLELKAKSELTGFANPKSSSGRLDILTRLITDEGEAFDYVPQGYNGLLYVEVVPRSFSIVARTGARLNQLRFSRAHGAASTRIAPDEWISLLNANEIALSDDKEAMSAEETGLLRFTADLRGGGEEGTLIGYRARKHAGRIDLDRRDYDPADFWEPIGFRKSSSLVLDPNEFYILMTREAVAVPPGYAAEMIPYDTRAGEFRVHYAGFFDPGFGWDAGTRKAGSSRAVLEVRSHEVPFLLEHGQTVGWLRYDRMAAPPDTLYGQAIGSNYQNQGLKLAKQFRL